MRSRVVLTVSMVLAIFTLDNRAFAQIWLEPRCKELAATISSPLVKLPHDRLMAIDAKGTRTSSDDGKTWSKPRKIYDGPPPGVPNGPTADYRIFLRTRAGALVVVYMDFSTQKWNGGSASTVSQDSRLDVWAIRSLDEGKTWIDRQKVLDGYCGDLIGMIQTSGGQIVAPMQFYFQRKRSVTLTCVSADDGKTWWQSNIIDLGGRGNHDGAIEATVAELSDGRLLMLMRTNLDRFWEAYSEDQGRYWRKIWPSRIDASSSPGYLIRLASGRLMLVWSRLYPEGKDSVVRRGGGGHGPGETAAEWELSETKASWQRKELSLAFSLDDAKTWTKPVVIVRSVGDISYPYVFERRPGELWIFTCMGMDKGLSLKEADFVPK